MHPLSKVLFFVLVVTVINIMAVTVLNGLNKDSVKIRVCEDRVAPMYESCVFSDKPNCDQKERLAFKSCMRGI